MQLKLTSVTCISLVDRTVDNHHMINRLRIPKYGYDDTYYWYTRESVTLPNVGEDNEDNWIVTLNNGLAPYDDDYDECTKIQAETYLMTQFESLKNEFPDADSFSLHYKLKDDNYPDSLSGYVYIDTNGNLGNRGNSNKSLYIKRKAINLAVETYTNDTIPANFQPCSKEEIINYINENKTELLQNDNTIHILYNYFQGHYYYAEITADNETVLLITLDHIISPALYTKKSSNNADTVSEIKLVETDQYYNNNSLPDDFQKCTPSAAKEYLINNLESLKQYFPDKDTFSICYNSIQYRSLVDGYQYITIDKNGNITKSVNSYFDYGHPESVRFFARFKQSASRI